MYMWSADTLEFCMTTVLSTVTQTVNHELHILCIRTRDSLSLISYDNKMCILQTETLTRKYINESSVHFAARLPERHMITKVHATLL